MGFLRMMIGILYTSDVLHQIINISIVPLEILHKSLVILEDLTLHFI